MARNGPVRRHFRVVAREAMTNRAGWLPLIALVSFSVLVAVNSFASYSLNHAEVCFAPPTLIPSLKLRNDVSLSKHTSQPFRVGTSSSTRSILSTIIAQWRGGGGGGGGGMGPRRGGRQDPRRFDTTPKGPPMNAAITFQSVRVVASNPDGKDEMLGVLTRDEALAIAAERVCP